MAKTDKNVNYGAWSEKKPSQIYLFSTGSIYFVKYKILEKVTKLRKVYLLFQNFIADTIN